MQEQRFNTQKAPVPPLRTEARPAPLAPTQGVQATPGGLIRSTLLAGGAAAAILTFFWVPAEYGIDPTGVGGLLGLTEMGAIKQQLYAEAAADDAAAAASAPIAPIVASTDPSVLERLTAIETQIAAIADVVGAIPPAEPAAVVAEPVAALPSEPAPVADAPADAALAPEPVPAPAVDEAIATPPAAAAGWRDEVSYTLAPGEGIEVKLAMEEGQIATFEWTANGGVLNHATHGDGSGQEISYEDGRAVPEQTGELTAAFTGNHGWFWRNRTDAPATVTLRTGGEYIQLKAP